PTSLTASWKILSLGNVGLYHPMLDRPADARSARSRPPQDTFMEHSDILVVGAGSAGAAMAARLSEEPTLRVTLVEAGSDTVPGEVPDDIKDIFPRSFLNSDYFWPNLTASLTDGETARPFPQARVVGGGSSVMGMIALRGLPSDYDGWEARGARNWGWRDVLPYFRAMTCDLDRSGPERNTSGPNIIHRLPREKWPLYMRRIEAGVGNRRMKWPSDFFATPLSQDRERASSARCYLTPEVRCRPNLKIMTSTSVRNLRIENGRVCGVVAKRDGETVILSASEVVVCAGAVHSAALLLRSGIGPVAELKALGIESVSDRPGVGKNYQNHSLLHFACRPSFKSFSRRALGCACTRRVRRGAQCKHRELAAERCVILQGSIATNGAQAGGGIRQPGGKTDTCPAADAGQDRNVLLAAMLIGRHVSNDAGRRLELVEFLARLGIDGLEVAFERSVEHHAAGGRQGARPDRELFRQRPDDLAGLAVPGNEVAHVGFAGRRIHRQRRPDIGLACRVADPERLIVHSELVGRHGQHTGVRRVGRWLLVFRTERRRADAFGVDILPLVLGRILRHDLRAPIGPGILVHVDLRGPVDCGIVFFGHQQLSGSAVERVAKAVAIEVNESPAVG